MTRRISLTTLTALLLLAAGCGMPGVPQPPSLELPKPVTNLKAARKGDTVTLTWTQPTKSTDGLLLRTTGKTKVCRGSGNCTEVHVSGDTGRYSESAETARRSATAGSTPSESANTRIAHYTVVVENRRGRDGGASNEVAVPVTNVEFAVSQLTAEAQGDGVHIRYRTSRLQNTPGSYSIELKTLRAEKGVEVFRPVDRKLVVANGTTETGGSEWEMVDDTIEWEKNYHYKIIGLITLMEKSGTRLDPFESNDSATVEIFAHDVFPPDPPTSVVAVANSEGSDRSVDLTWSPNTERDLAGYNVYRREPEYAVKYTKLNTEMLRGASFKDITAKAGHNYEYAITAVDVRGNESKTSAPAAERVPQ